MKKGFCLKSIFFASLAFFPLMVSAHEGKDHSEKESSEEWEVISEEVPKVKLKQINKIYLSTIEPVFRKKCLDCHGSGNQLPWYASIPGPKQLIESDIKEAKEHMDMSEGFPFKGHGAPVDDLESLRKTLDEGTMPPFQYKLMHWGSALNKEEKNIVYRWINESLKTLNNKEK